MTLLAIGVNLSTSVLSFRSRFWSLFFGSSLCPTWLCFLAQKRLRLNLDGVFFPPENWIICHPSMLLLSPSGINSSELSAKEVNNLGLEWGRWSMWSALIIIFNFRRAGIKLPTQNSKGIKQVFGLFKAKTKKVKKSEGCGLWF